jgi:hypothetical protein
LHAPCRFAGRLYRGDPCLLAKMNRLQLPKDIRTVRV